MPVNGDFPVVSDAEWQLPQPTLVKRLSPVCAADDRVAGAGGAERRMKAAKFTVSDDIVDAVPVVLPSLTMLVESSGEALNTQPLTAERSFVKSSFETPCS